MARQRMNDTVAISSRPSSGMTSHSIRTREIDNGFLVCESSCNPQTGEYRETERFMPTAPRIIPGKVARGVVGRDGDLADAVGYLNE